MGNRVELDLDMLSKKTSPEIADAVLAYHTTCLEFQEYLAARATGYRNEARPSITIRRPLMKVTQIDRKDSRKDLSNEIDELAKIAIVGEFVSTLLDTKTSKTRTEKLERLSTALGATVEQIDENKTVATFAIASPNHIWPEILGGAATPGEVNRVFTLTANHAAWRDRRVRRLQTLEISVDELWAHPLNAAAKIARIIVEAAEAKK